VQLQPRERRTETEMDACRKRQVPIRLPVKDKCIGIRKCAAVAIGGLDPEVDFLTACDVSPAQRDLSRGYPLNATHRTAVAQHLFDRYRQLCWIRAQRLLRRRMLVEAQHRICEG